MLDYGANFSVMSLNTVKSVGLTASIEPSDTGYWVANGASDHSLGFLRQIPTMIGNTEYLVDYEISQSRCYDVLLGSEFHLQFGLVPNCRLHTLTLTSAAGEETVPIILGDSPPLEVAHANMIS